MNKEFTFLGKSMENITILYGIFLIVCAVGVTIFSVRSVAINTPLVVLLLAIILLVLLLLVLVVLILSLLLLIV